MNYQKLLATLMICGYFTVYAETSTNKSIGGEDKADTEALVDKLVIPTESTKEGVKNSTELSKKENKKVSSEAKAELDPETKTLQKIKQKLAVENALRTERLKSENADLLAKLQKLKWEKDIISEQLAIKEVKRKRDNRDATIAYEDELLRITREANLEKERVAKLSIEFEAKKLKWDLKRSRLSTEIEELKVAKERETYVDQKPVYLDNPLTDDNTLVISDRRIALDGPILQKTADYITRRINYYNNKDSKKPIFIVIGSSPGGSVMAGYRIMKAIDASKATVYVVLKTYAASMAAAMVTLAKKSFAYPNAIMLHHQISQTFYLTRLNLTQQKENYAETEKWWKRLGKPLAKKMGITPEEFIKKMYENSSDGDWSEFASDAKKLNWVDHIVDRIEETSLLKDPNSEHEKAAIRKPITASRAGDQERPVVYLPRLSPKDMYFLYNPDHYYQLR